MSDAKMILMDEPIAGVNPTLAHEIFKKIRDICRTQKITFLIVEHRLDISLQYVEHVLMTGPKRQDTGRGGSARSHKAPQGGRVISGGVMVYGDKFCRPGNAEGGDRNPCEPASVPDMRTATYCLAWTFEAKEKRDSPL